MFLAMLVSLLNAPLRCSRLGHGDTTSYVNPKLIEALKDDIIFELSCGCWHTVAVVLIPPLLKGGLVRSGDQLQC